MCLKADMANNSTSIQKMFVAVLFARVCPDFGHFYRFYFGDHLHFSKFQISVIDAMHYAGVMLCSLIFFKFCNKINLIYVFGLSLIFGLFARLLLIPGIIDGVVASPNF